MKTLFMNRIEEVMLTIKLAAIGLAVWFLDVIYGVTLTFMSVFIPVKFTTFLEETRPIVTYLILVATFVYYVVKLIKILKTDTKKEEK